MFRLVLSGLLIQFKRDWGKFFAAFLCMVLYVYIILVAVNGLAGKTTIDTKDGMNIMIASSGVLLYLSGVFKNIPLRVCRGLFVCSAGKEERMRYLWMQLFVKIALGGLLLTCILIFGFGGFFISEFFLMRVSQIVIWISLLYTMNLRIGIGIKGNRKHDKEGYAIYSKSEVAVNEYWTSLLIILVVVFYTTAILLKENNLMLQGGILLASLGVNVYYAIRYTKSVLEEALNYENVYHQEPIKPVEQYDICQNWAK